MKLPRRLFFTGVPGSRWSGVAQYIEKVPGFNTTDRNEYRQYNQQFQGTGYTFGHLGAYFGREMEFEARLNADYIDQAWAKPGPTQLVKSHDWAYCLADIKKKFPDDWIMMVYRSDIVSYAWWFEIGGFTIKYPSYSAYKNPSVMMGEISAQNFEILKFAAEQNCQWGYLTGDWIEKTFGHYVEVDKRWCDLLVTVIK